MERPKHIRVRDDRGNHRVVLEIATGLPAHVSPPRYELPNRERVTAISDNEFVVVRTGAILTRLK